MVGVIYITPGIWVFSPNKGVKKGVTNCENY